QPYPECRAAQRRGIQTQTAPVALDDIADHGQAYALSRVRRIQARPSADDPFALILRHPRTIVLDPDFPATGQGAGTDADARQAQTVGVLQQIAQQLQQGTLLDRQPGVLGHVQLQFHVLVPVHLAQRLTQFAGQRPQGGTVPDQPAAAQTGALQLVVDLLAHALDLIAQNARLLPPGRLGAQILHHGLQYRQRRLQTVRQIRQRIPVTGTLQALAVDQAVERLGQAAQLPGMLVAQVLAAAALDFLQLPAHTTQ